MDDDSLLEIVIAYMVQYRSRCAPVVQTFSCSSFFSRFLLPPPPCRRCRPTLCWPASRRTTRTASPFPLAGRVQRPNTVAFRVPGLEKTSRTAAPDVLRDVLRSYEASQVSCLQARGTDGYLLTFGSQASVIKALDCGLKIGDQLIDVEQVSGGLTAVTITDLPYEIPNDVLRKELSIYGSIKRIDLERYPPELSNIPTGNRKVFIALKKRIPNILTVAGFEVLAWYRDVEKMCRRCGGDGHRAADCEQPVVRVKRCDICGNRWHTAAECTGCRNCRAGTHAATDCPFSPPTDAAFPPLTTDAVPKTVDPDAFNDFLDRMNALADSVDKASAATAKTVDSAAATLSATKRSADSATKHVHAAPVPTYTRPTKSKKKRNNRADHEPMQEDVVTNDSVPRRVDHYVDLRYDLLAEHERLPVWKEHDAAFKAGMTNRKPPDLAKVFCT